MSLHITHQMIEGAYELLRETPPFRRWKLPEADDVSFAVMDCETHAADYLMVGDKTHRIRINNKWTGTLSKLIANLAHEMVHLHLQCACPNDQAAENHGPAFQKAAAQVCKHHGFDMKGF
jgi:hypothetical protein